MLKRKRSFKRLLAATLGAIMLFTATVPSALAAGEAVQGAGKRSIDPKDYESSTMPKEELDRMRSGQTKPDDVLMYAPMPEEAVKRTVKPMATGYEFDPDLPFIQEELKIPTFAYIPCTVGGRVVKINLDTEKVVASYWGSSSGTAGPRRVAYDQNQNAWIGNLSDDKASIMVIKSDIDGYSSGSTSITSDPNGSLPFAQEKASQEFALPGAVVGSDPSQTGSANMKDVRCIAFDSEGHLWVGPSSGNYIREFEVIPQGVGENQTFTLKVRRTIVLTDSYAGAYVVAFNQKGDLYISEIGNKRVFVVDLANHDEKYPVDGIPEAQRYLGDPNFKNKGSRALISPGGSYSIYAVASDLYTGDVWATGYDDNGKIYRITPDQNYVVYNTSPATASLGTGHHRRTGIEFDTDYVYVNSNSGQSTIRFNREHVDNPTAFVNNADAWNIGTGTPHGLFPYEGKLFLIRTGGHNVAVLNAKATPPNTTGTPKIHTPTLNSITTANQPYVYGAFGVKKLPPGASLKGRALFMPEGEIDWAAVQSGREGMKYEVRRMGKAPWHTENNELLYYAKSDADGNMLFWVPGRPESSAISSVHLEQGNYTITEVQAKANEYGIMAGVEEGGHKDDRVDSKTLKVSIRDKESIRADFAYATPSIEVFPIPPQPIPQNYPLPVRVTVYSPTGLPSQITIKRQGESDLVYDVVKDPAKNIAYVDIKETDINFSLGSKVVAVVPNPAGGTMEISQNEILTRIDMLNPIITAPGDDTELTATSITIKDAPSTNKYMESGLDNSKTKFTLTPKTGGAAIVKEGQDWATIYPTIPAGVYDVEIYAQDNAQFVIAPNSATKTIKNAIIDNGTETDQIDIDIDYDITTWTNGEVTGTATIHSTLPITKAEINGQPYTNIIPTGTPGEYTVNGVKFQTNTGTVGSEDYDLKALTTKGSYADNTSKVTWVDKLNPVVDGPASGKAVKDITGADFNITDPAATNDYGMSQVNTAATRYALITPNGSRTEGTDIAVLIANALARPAAGNYMIRVITEDVATNPGTNGANGSIKPGPGGEDEVEFGPFPGDGGTPPGPSGDLKVTFPGGESILQNLKASSGTFNFSVDRTLRGKTVSIALGSGTITTSATVPVTGALRASYSGVTVGPNTLTITIDGKMWTGSVNFK